jgi:hypothetical protein
MRSMSMLQLLGGVAVAGAVAAGTTAFTGSGLTATTNTAKSFIGGTVTQNINGATIDHVDYTFTDATKTVMTGFDVTFTDTTVDTKTPTASLSTTGGTWAGATTVSCNPVATNTAKVTNCTLASNYTLGTVNSFSMTIL